MKTNTLFFKGRTFVCPCCEFDRAHGQSYIRGQFEDLDEELSEKVKPRGASRPLSPIPELNLTEQQIDDAIAFFEQMFGESEELEIVKSVLGMLRAQAVGEPQYDVEDERLAPQFDDEDDNWEWLHEDFEYHNSTTGETVNESQKNQLSVDFIDLHIISLLSITAMVILKEISIQRWIRDIRWSLVKGVSAQYLLGSGGKNTIGDYDLLKIRNFITGQWSFLQKFGEEIAGGELSGAQVLSRIQMYGEASTHGYEQAKAKTHNVDLPEYPADGNQDCYSKCRCHWEIRDDANDPEFKLCYWRLNPRAEHCNVCIANAREYNPLKIEQGLSLEEQYEHLLEDDGDEIDLDEL